MNHAQKGHGPSQLPIQGLRTAGNLKPEQTRSSPNDSTLPSQCAKQGSSCTEGKRGSSPSVFERVRETSRSNGLHRLCSGLQSGILRCMQRNRKQSRLECRA